MHPCQTVQHVPSCQRQRQDVHQQVAHKSFELTSSFQRVCSCKWLSSSEHSHVLAMRPCPAMTMHVCCSCRRRLWGLVDEAAARADAATSESTTLRRELDAARSDSAASHQAEAALRSVTSKLQAQVSELKRDLAEATKRAESKSQADSVLASTQRALSDAHKNASQLNQELRELKAELDRERGKGQEAAADVKRLNQDLEKLGSEYQAVVTKLTVSDCVSGVGPCTARFICGACTCV